jgi:hypothetical protein
VVAIILSAACLFITVFGCFISMFAPRTEYGIAANDSTSNDTDYILYVSGGSSMPDNFYITLPRKMGISQKDLDDLRETDGIEVQYANVNHMSSHFILYRNGENNQYFSNLVQEKRVLNHENTPQINTAIEQAGGKANDILVEPYFIGMDYDTLTKSVNIINGNVNETNFIKGTEVIAPSLFNVGDSFVLITPIIKDENAPVNSDKRFEFIVTKVTVSATYEGDSLIYSAEAIMKTDPTARYDEISIINTKKNDVAASQQIEKKVERITASSLYTSLINFDVERQNYYNEIRNGQFLTVISVIIFIVLVIIAITLSTQVKLRTNMHSYILMRSIGAKNKLIISLVKSDIKKVIINGSVIGTLFGYFISIFLIQGFMDTPFMDIFLYMILSAICVFMVLRLFVNIALRKPLKKLVNENIIDEINAVEF